MEKAVELYTLGSARAEFMEDRKGMIRVGYLGDVVIFDTDLVTAPPERIMSARVDYTIVGGKILYRRNAPAGLITTEHASQRMPTSGDD